MSRPSPAISASTSAPVVANGHASLLQIPEKQVTRTNRSLSVSSTKLPPAERNQNTDVDPDELFSKHTIAEIRFIQQSLRADADAKQEELRLMVGERYRDLLQASSSIIAIASSSQRVKRALDETKEVILVQEEPPMPQKPSLKKGNDAHLHTLQLLSAHVKLLLDAPEHLWRLIERKKYFPAAWLFLLARVIHRALVREDEQDVTWSSQGVDILEEFPLVQRQWDSVSQFRSQIIHKATHSLREYNLSVEDTCSTLLTLHLLDSRPLMETLSVFLTQRSKTLQTLLLWKYDSDSAGSQTKKQNGHAAGSGQPASATSSDFRRRPVKEIKEATHAVLDAISETIKTAQRVFQEDAAESRPSLIRRVLEYIQSDSPNSSETQSIPAELCLTTQTLLTTLPSSTHFLILPPDLRSYKPYVDLNSSSSSVQASQFTQKLNDWFQKSTTHLQKAVGGWLAALHNVKELWSVRASTQRWFATSGLQENEAAQIRKLLDELYQRRVVEIWKLRLAESLGSFGERLDSTLLSLTQGGKAKHKGAHCFPAIELLERMIDEAAPPAPSQTSLGAVDTSFPKYTNSLRRQLVGRTALLDDVLATLESCARTIRQDLAHVMAGAESPDLVEQLKTTYSPDADALCSSVIEKLEKTGNSFEEVVTNTDGLVFLSRVSDELSSSSPFISEIGCQPSVLKDFRQTTSALHGRVVVRWRTCTVSSIVREHRLASKLIHPALKGQCEPSLHLDVLMMALASLKPSGPSSHLVQSLLTLSTSLQDLGVPRSQPWQRTLVKSTLEHFITELTGDGWDESCVQASYDMTFLWKLATLVGEGENEFPSQLEKRIRENLPAEVDLDTLQKSAAESLARMQTLLATVLPPQKTIPVADSTDKFSALLRFGTPPQEGQFQPALELAKPTSRFGLLLVGGV
ncbi:hypothetical protein H0H92_002105 [Tricholoma furcatifolium]|nr:hypothetical protein H0H92_002105 [Tricholoma furcatifolium]